MNFTQTQRRITTLAIVVSTSIAVAMPAFAKVEATWHRDFDPAHYRTYSWAASSSADSEAADAIGTDFDLLVRRAIEQRLESLGYEKAAAGHPPDFRIQYGATKSKSSLREVNPVPVPFNAENWINRGWETLRNSFWEATLVLTVRDGGTDEPVWCGWITERVRTRRLERQTQTWVRRILHRFPTDVAGTATRP